MQLNQLDDTVWVTGQLYPADMARIAEQGFTAVINNRPDGEAAGQPSSSEIAAAAEAAGLAYAFIPLKAPQLSQAHITDFAAALAESKGKTLAFCRSGQRSAMLWALANAADRPPAQLLASAAAAGYDLANLAPLLARLAA